ncbi:hypothetical protein ACFWPA_10250 [Rhodococcus sp. NPDC058505]|uniref:hypothetical protein n=1 Tax=unclassified Rhodococcus (in: high G+C Gram-positive bacteria) TaxID=192944 RepID=UPI0036646F05
MTGEGAARPVPPRWWRATVAAVSVLVATACAVILWAFVPPVVYFPFVALAGWALMILGAVWLALTLVRF